MRTQAGELSAANTALRRTTAFWFLITVIGQWAFLTYVVVEFGSTAVRGNFEAWNKHLSNGYAPGDDIGNIAVAMHLLLAVIILGGGPLQLIPQIRGRFPTFHRWLGRGYMLAVLIAMMTGLYMLFTHDIGSLYLKAGFVIQANLIVIFSAFSLRYAIARNINKHRRWALRFFIVASIALFYRVILMIWVLITGGVGINFTTGEGVFLDFMALGQYLPLLILEMYFQTQDRGGMRSRFALAGFLFICAAATGLGITLLSVGMWFPAGPALS